MILTVLSIKKTKKSGTASALGYDLTIIAIYFLINERSHYGSIS